MWENLGFVMIFIGATGSGYQCLVFVRDVLPQNLGKNPGFGCFETMLMPWVASCAIGLGLAIQSWQWGAAFLAVAIVSSGFLGGLLSRVFGRPD